MKTNVLFEGVAPYRKMDTLVKVIFYAVLGTAAVIACLYFVWWAVSVYKIKRAGPPPQRAHRKRIWNDPGEVERLDFHKGPGGPDGAPAPPFRFVIEHATGSNPCLSVKDARGRTWRVKWGDEVRSETFATRLAWAAGYFVETAYFVPEGLIDGAVELTRARTCVGEDCTFKDARFELDEEGVTKLFDEHGWAWNDNPFTGTRELNGLKIMVMLTSNWDNKDVRDVARGSNMAVFEHRLEKGLVEARYLIIDWGASMGKWGSPGLRSKWDCEGYETQTPEFVAGVSDGVVNWNYVGQRTDEARDGISVEDVRWLNQYIGRITDAQLRDGLAASGATGEEIACFTRAIRERINQLKRVGELGDAYEAQSPSVNAQAGEEALPA
ncbi:MAG TPA: hypothetical protein VM934_11415 [Pyrinomonadaceae bacterium]|nr:hypothetical protein [Pyrinomonadaceae bacterium]